MTTSRETGETEADLWTWGHWGYEGIKTMRLSLERAKGERRAGCGSTTQCTSFFSLQLLFPLPVAPARRWEVGAQGQGSAAVLLGCWQGSSPAHRPLSSSSERVGVRSKWSLVSWSLHPPIIEGNLCAVVCLPLPDRAQPQDNTREISPAY